MDNQIYALKRIKLTALKPKEKKNTLNEVRILASIKSPYIIGYRDAFFDTQSNDFCVITEYAEGGDLFEIIKELKKVRKYVSENRVWGFLDNITHGLKELHDLKIIHRDLKGANILL